MTAKTWLDSVEKQKKKNRFEGAAWQTNRQTDGQTESIVDS